MATIRKACEADLDRLYELFRKTYGEDYLERYDSAWLQDAVSDEKSIFFVAEEEGEMGTDSDLRGSADPCLSPISPVPGVRWSVLVSL